jgi:hypothetical protein
MFLKWIRQWWCKDHKWVIVEINQVDHALNVSKKNKCSKCGKIRFKTLNKFFKWQYRVRD